MHHWNYHYISPQVSSGFDLNIITIIISVATLLFVIDEYFERKRRVYKEKISEFYAQAYEYVKFQEEAFKNEKVFNDGVKASHATTGFFCNFENCKTELLNRQDALLDLIFKKVSHVSLEVLQSAFFYEKGVHADGLLFNDKILIDRKLELCRLIKRDYFEYKEKAQRWILFR